MPREFSYPHGNDFPGQYQFASLPRTDIWVPAAVSPKDQADANFNEFDAAIGRLGPRVSLSEAQSEMSAIEKRLEPLHPEGQRDLEALLVPFIETTIGPVRPLLRLLMGAVCLVLLLACANFASLLMARAADRVHELGVRTALGAGRARLIRLMLTESLMLSVAGGALATLASFGFLKIIVKLNSGGIPRFDQATLGARVLLFGFSVSLATGLTAGLFPALSASSANVGELLRQGGRGIIGASSRARSLLIVAEIALSVLLLAGAGLLIRSYLTVEAEAKGFDQSTLTMSVMLDQQTENSDQLRRAIMDRIRSLPGVQSAGSIDDLPLSTYQDKGFLDVEGYVSRMKELASVRETGGEYFTAMRIPLIAGRYLNDRDISAANRWPGTVVVSQSFSKRYFAGRSPIGHRLRVNGSPWSTIVGVVGNVRHSSLEEAPEPTIYCQNGLADSVAIRAVGSPDAIVSSIRRAMSALDSSAALTDIRTMGRYVDEASARRRFQTVALTSFAGVAIFLALLGLYGLLSCVVRQRTTEIGVRMALGATPDAVLGMIVRYGLKLSLAGLAIGTCLALALARGMASLLYGVEPVDPTTFMMVPAFIVAVAVIACLAPAWRAARTDPITALQHR